MAFAAVIGFALSAHAQESDTPVASLLDKWRKATSDCLSLDINLIRITYDPFDKPTDEKGRFYFEASGIGRYQVGDTDAIIWQDDAKLLLDFKRRTYHRISLSVDQIAALRQGERELLSQESLWFRGWRLHWIRLDLMQPQDALPFVLLTDAEDFRKRFDVSVEEKEKELWLTAKPRQIEFEYYRELQFIFDHSDSSASHLPKAIKEVQRFGGTVVYVLDARMNVVPPDRDELLRPNLSSWKCSKDH